MSAAPGPPLAGTIPPLRPGLVGIAGVDVADADRAAGAPPRIRVTLQPANAIELAPWLLQRSGYALTGGARLHPRVAAIDQPAGSPAVVVLTLESEGDRSTYGLRLRGPGADPFHDSAVLRFRLDCATDADCAAEPLAEPPATRPSVRVDYLARDFESLRRALLDFVPTRVPGWTETNEADAGVMLLELLAATADGFAYVLDRVANEAFLGTATQRRSVAGHLALVGHALDEGASAETLLHLRVARPHLLATGFAVRTAVEPADQAAVFETVADRLLRPEHNEMLLYGWDSPDGFLPAGATSAYLTGELPRLAAGDLVALRDTGTGTAELVRLAGAPQPVPAASFGTPPLTLISWAAATHADHPVARTVVLGNLVPATHGRTGRARVVLGGGAGLSQSAATASAEAIARPQTARPGDPVLVTVWGLPDGTEVVLVVEAPDGDQQRIVLTQDIPGGVEAAVVPLPADAPPGTWRALVGTTVEEALGAPRASASWEVAGIGDAPTAAPAGPPPRLRVPVPEAPLAIDAAGRPQLVATLDGVAWALVPSLLDSGPRDRVFTLELAEGGTATLLFGQGGTTADDRTAFGLRPADGSVLDLRYRIGLGLAGNVAADTLTVPAAEDGSSPGDWFRAVTNPVPATGGREPESLADARRTGPSAARRRLVAVTPGDYVQAVADFDRAAGGGLVARAGAGFRWTGSWPVVELVLDLGGGVTLDDTLTADLLAFLGDRRLAGYDVRLLRARELPLQLTLDVCAAPGFLAEAVRRDVAAALRPGPRPDGTRGFFDPAGLSFGDPIILSRLYLAVTSVPGVRSVTVDVLAPLHSVTTADDTATVLATGQLSVGRDQIARLDDDPSDPERGRLTVVMAGGRR
ncbi:MAG TPA: hypothetical protein VFP89_09675 [Propionibacteriaceae bacterium]|nr:hypothetical protein [Propionibacteriaceae bacterium]